MGDKGSPVGQSSELKAAFSLDSGVATERPIWQTASDAMAQEGRGGRIYENGDGLGRKSGMAHPKVIKPPMPVAERAACIEPATETRVSSSFSNKVWKDCPAAAMICGDQHASSSGVIVPPSSAPPLPPRPSPAAASTTTLPTVMVTRASVAVAAKAATAAIAAEAGQAGVTTAVVERAQAGGKLSIGSEDLSSREEEAATYAPPKLLTRKHRGGGSYHRARKESARSAATAASVATVVTTTAATINASARHAGAAEASAVRLTTSSSGVGGVGAVAHRGLLSGRPRGTVDDPCEVVVADAVRFLVSSSSAGEQEERGDEDVVAAVAAAAAAATGADPSLACSRAFRRSSRRLLLRSAMGRGLGIALGGCNGQQLQKEQALNLSVVGKLSANVEQQQKVPGAGALSLIAGSDGSNTIDDGGHAEQQQNHEVTEPRSSFSSNSDGGDSFHSALSRVGSSGSVSVSSPAAPAVSAAGNGIGIGIDGSVIGKGNESELDSSIGQIGCSRSSYRPRGVSYGEKPWRSPDAKGVSSGGVYIGGLGDDGGSASPKGEGYRPGNGQGLVVSEVCSRCNKIFDFLIICVNNI